MPAGNEIEFLVRAKDQFSGTMGGITKSLGIAGGAFATVGAAAIAAGGAMFSMVKYAAGLQDEMRRNAIIANETIGSFSALAHTASLADVSTQQLTTSFAYAQRAMGEAASGSETMRKAFDSVGVSFKDANGNLKSGSGLLADFAVQMENGADRTTIMNSGMQIFGRSFKEMIPLLAEGSEGLRRGAEDARFLGLVMNDQAAANADAFGDELTRLGGALKGVGMAIGNEWTPMMTGLVREAANWVASIRGTLGEWAAQALQGMVKFYVFAEQVITGISAGFKRLFTAEGFNDFLQGGMHAFRAIFETAINFISNLGPMFIEVFKMTWAAFAEIGKWGFQKLFDLLTGQNLADTLGEVLFARIPEATEKYRSQFMAAGATLSDGVKQGVGELAGIISTGLGIDMEAVDKRAEQIIQKFSVMGEVAKTVDITPSVAGMDQIAMELEQAYVKIGAVSMQYEEFYKASLQREVEAFRQKGVDEETLALYTQQRMMEMEMMAFEARLEMKRTQQEQEMAMEVAYQQSRFSMIGSFADQTALKEAQARQQGLQFQKLTDAEKLKTTIKTGAETLSAVAGTNKTLFNLNKAFSLAQAASALPSAVIQSFQRAGGYPWGIVPAALMAAAGAAQISKIASSSYSGAAHGGMDFVPKESTYLLDKGERVLSPRQNTDLTDFISTQNTSGVNIESLTIHILENATSGDALLAMSPIQMREIVAEKILPALDSLSRMGVRPL